MKPNLAHS